MLALAACGHVEAIKPPNTISACDRALVCGAILDGQHDACVACLEHVDPEVLADLREKHGDLPPLDSVSCETIASVVKLTNLGQCIDSRWYGPFDFVWGP
jgi:hypothetical protein